MLGRSTSTSRWIAIRACRDAYEAGEKIPSAAELSKRLITEAKNTADRGWLSGVSAVVLQQALRDADRAHKNFFDSLSGKRAGRKVGVPRFKSKRDRRQAVRFTANARWSVTSGGKLRLPKIGDVPVRWSRALPSTPSSVTVVKDAAGRYFASFVVDTNPEPIDTDAPELGVDLGLGQFAVLSDGTKISAPKFLRNAEKKVKRAQRDLARKERGSKNKDKAKIKVARGHARVADARCDFHHQLSTRLIRENQAIAVEDLAVSGLARTRLAKSVHDSGWSAFVGMLEYKAALYGRKVVRIGRFEPTSQVCSNCGSKDGPKPLHIRTWQCSACGAHLDRDVNAAVNVAKAAGLAVTACGAHVRPEPVRAERGEAGTHRGDLAVRSPCRQAW
ncbi:RNA-guided endonuclease InsQ/TnpB family protein [Saccharopolyspora sp. NPDC002376]